MQNYRTSYHWLLTEHERGDLAIHDYLSDGLLSYLEYEYYPLVSPHILEPKTE